MGHRRNELETRTARLILKKETLRRLQTLTDEEMRAVAGGWGTGTTNCVELPSCKGC